MSYLVDDTIAAIATAEGGGARAIVRVSGPKTIDTVTLCFAPSDGRSLVECRQATAIPGCAQIVMDGCPRSVPCDLFLWPTSRSYTRQAVAELHTLGPAPIAAAMLATVCEKGARLAEPGEFTLRAFLAGRIDLTQAEAVLGIIDARSEKDLQVSLAQLAGGLTRPLHELREELLQLLAEMEAGLDFVEEDIEFVSAHELAERLASASRQIGGIADQMASRLSAPGLEQVALIGRPNAGKSSLFNALMARFGHLDKRLDLPCDALVSSLGGTTRDYLSVTISVDGMLWDLIDTAGVDEIAFGGSNQTTAIGAAAQELTAARRTQATIRAWCSESINPDGAPADCDVIVLTKADSVSHAVRPSDSALGDIPIVLTSSRTGLGLDELGRVLVKLLSRESLSRRPAPFVSTTADRCRESIRLAETAVHRAAKTVAEVSGDELVAVEIREALTELGKIVGTVYTDDLLDRIFSRFCIGK